MGINPVSFADIKAWYRNDILNLVLSLASANPNPHPEFIRALVAVASAVGISREELSNRRLKG